jgi:hypothetical protein
VLSVTVPRIEAPTTCACKGVPASRATANTIIHRSETNEIDTPVLFKETLVRITLLKIVAALVEPQLAAKKLQIVGVEIEKPGLKAPGIAEKLRFT